MEDFVLCFPFPFIFIFFSPWASLNTLFLKIDRILLFFLARSTSVIYNAFAPRHFCRCLTFSRSLQEHCVVLAFLIFHVEEGKKTAQIDFNFKSFLLPFWTTCGLGLEMVACCVNPVPRLWFVDMYQELPCFSGIIKCTLHKGWCLKS